MVNKEKTMKVARWEFMKNLKSPTFLILTFVFPIIMLIAGGIGILTSIFSALEEQTVAVIDETGGIYPILETKLDDTPVTVALYQASQEDQLRADVEKGLYNGLLYLTEEGIIDGSFPYYVKDSRDQNTGILAEALRSSVISYRLEKHGLSREEIETTTARVSMRTQSLAGEEASLANFILPFAVAMVLIFSVMFSGQVLMYGVIKEKRNRIVEILLSSVSSLELLMGKLIGFAALGLLQVTIWLAVGLSVAGSFINLSQVSLTPGDLVPSLMFFFGGYLLFASLFAAMGATMKDAEGGSQTQGLVVIIPMIPVFAAGSILLTPNALWVRIISFIPIFTPVTMLMRIAATTVPWWEIIATFIILIMAVFIFIVLGARIFSRSILQFEKTLSMKDIRNMLKR